jgi:WhiB family redox-sensing transcriptional regulator
LTELLLWLAGSTGWWFEGVCAQTDPEVFFPEKGGSVREAKAVCARCPVRAQCLAHALAHGERFGVWGGLSEPERRRLQLHAGSAAGGSTAPEPAAQQPDPPAAVPVAGEVDEVVVARLISGRPVSGASRDEVAQAAIGMHRAGVGARQVAAQLDVNTRQVERWVARHRGGQPLCPMAGPRPGPRPGQRRAARSAVA